MKRTEPKKRARLTLDDYNRIRALAAWLFRKQGIDPQARMAHSDAKSTRIYTENHVDWVSVPHAEIRLFG